MVLNAYPYASGHALVLPRRHVGSFKDLSQAEKSQMWQATETTIEAVGNAYEADGFNIGANLGRAAGAGIPGHLHFHVVPRWTGDTNFMTSVASVRVMPESLVDTWRRLSAAWPNH